MLPRGADALEVRAVANDETLYVGTRAGLVVFLATATELHELRRALEGHAVTALTARGAQTVLALTDGLPPQQSRTGGLLWHAAPEATLEPIGLRVATLAGPAPLANPRLMGATAYARLGTRQPTLLGAGAGGGLLFRSTDDGIHWEPAAGPVRGRVTAIVPSTQTGRAWAGTDAGQLLRSGDGGTSWHEATRLEAPILSLAAGA